MDRDGMNILYRGPSIDASYQVSVHLAKRLQKRRMFKISQWQFMFIIVCFLKKNCFSVEREITNLNIDISKIQLAMNWITDKYASKTPQPNELKLGRKHIWKALIAPCLKSANQKQESPMVAMFVNGTRRKEQWGPSIYASYQVSVHLAEGF
jgi:hypothetical protein